jgi:beta-galactosidase/beta-glucuronidase
MLSGGHFLISLHCKWRSNTKGAPPFTLNNEPLHFRGFSHHNSIGGLGVAIPERVQLFRVQASRAMGTNIWRMSHNPYDNALYDLLDATGQMCWDENRDYGAKYVGVVLSLEAVMARGVMEEHALHHTSRAVGFNPLLTL